MKYFNQYIQEKLKISSSSKINSKQSFTDEELKKDYEIVRMAFSKSEKLPYMQKYGVTENKIESICQKILELLRDNRHNKTEFDKDDAMYFYKLNIPDIPYKKSEEFFDQEPIEFIQYLKSYFENENEYFKRARQSFRRYGRMSAMSIADRHQLTMYNNVIKYLCEKNRI